MGCPKCGGNEGYIAHDYFSGWAGFIGGWGKDDNEECPTFNDDVTIKKISNTAICLQCRKRIARPYNRGN